MPVLMLMLITVLNDGMSDWGRHATLCCVAHGILFEDM